MKKEINIFSILNRINMKELNLPEGPYSVDNYYVPRVSEILSKMIHEDYLMTWANNMGRRGFSHKAISQQALDYGSELHHRAEILLGKDQEKKDEIINLNDMNSYIALKDWISYYGDRLVPLYQETSLSCPYYGGTFDLLASIDGKKTLIDFKTSKSVTYKYFLQLAAYDYLIKTNMNIDLNAVMILQLDKRCTDYTEYIIDLHIDGHRMFHEQCKETFMSLVYAYYNIYKTEMMYPF